MIPTITFREACSLPHLITSLYSLILPPSTNSVRKISVCHNELAQARHKFLAKAQIQPTALANFFFSVQHLHLCLLCDSLSRSWSVIRSFGDSQVMTLCMLIASTCSAASFSSVPLLTKIATWHCTTFPSFSLSSPGSVHIQSTHRKPEEQKNRISEEQNIRRTERQNIRRTEKQKTTMP